MSQLLQRVVFLDRDGVINRDSPDYIKSWSEFELLPGSVEALRRLTTHGFTTIIITNQSAVNRKLISRNALLYIHARLKAIVKSHGGKIENIFFCPHTPEEGCDCRKPKPGLILQARKMHRIDLSTSCMVGDSAKDIACARNAGCRSAVLVKTGNGIEAEKILADQNISPDHVAQNLYAATHWIIAQHAASPPYPAPPKTA